MKTVTYEQFLAFGPCWLSHPEQEKQLKEIGSRQEKWTALDVLELDDVSEEDRLCLVLRTEFLPDKILHEFSCQCAERALSRIDNPDPRSVNAIAVKRKWMAGGATDAELYAARVAARFAERVTARVADASDDVECIFLAVWAAAHAAYATSYADSCSAASASARYASNNAAWGAELDTESADKRQQELQWQIETLINLIREEEA